MASQNAEFDLLLEAPDPTTAKLAQDVLEQGGIPSMLAENASDTIHLAYGLRSPDARPNLLVPKGARDRALAMLREAWDREALTDEIALSAGGEAVAAQPVASRGIGAWGWLVVAVIVLILVLTYVDDFFS
jgi:Putative prokaryotic signal transducing protein